jgi:hypothetical protein
LKSVPRAPEASRSYGGRLEGNLPALWKVDRGERSGPLVQNQNPASILRACGAVLNIGENLIDM